MTSKLNGSRYAICVAIFTELSKSIYQENKARDGHEIVKCHRDSEQGSQFSSSNSEKRASMYHQMSFCFDNNALEVPDIFSGMAFRDAREQWTMRVPGKESMLYD
jgi:hypothetical protein